MIQTPPCFITGIPRSGSSAIAAIIHACGAFGGSMSKRSMYCNDTIREVLVKPYLDRLNADPDGQNPLPGTDTIVIPAYWRGRVEQVIKDEGYKEGAWMYKDSRLAVTWPLWNISFPNAKWIIVRRRTGDVVQSCMKTGYMKAFKDEAGWLGMVDQYEKRFVEMINEGVNHKIIWPERMVDGDYNQLYELCDWLGLKWNDKAVEHLDRLLWKGTKTITHGSTGNVI
jgi:lambda repressor-like predicted transcriptional regulator